MDFLTTILLESPLYLGVASFAAFSIVLLTRRRLSERAARISLPLVVGGIAVAFIIQNLVVTTRERITQRLHSFVAAIEQNDAVQIGAHLSGTFETDAMNRSAMLVYLAERLNTLSIYDTRIGRSTIAATDETADMNLLVTATVRQQVDPGERHVSRWRLGWVREPDQWRIVSIAPVMIDGLPMRSLAELRAAIP